MRKDLTFEKDAREALAAGVAKMARAVGSTMGPHGRTVIIEDPNRPRGNNPTKDGVTVAKSIALPDEIENLAVNIVREAAELTAKKAGDGTTATLVLANAIIEKGMKLLEKNPGINVAQLLRQTQEEVDRIIQQIEASAVEVDDSKLDNVATISVNGDEKLGTLIADAFRSVGRDGVVTFQHSKSGETYYEATHGIQITRGYSSPLFKTNREKNECVLENCHILVCDVPLNQLVDIEGILGPIIQSKGKESILIISELKPETLNAMGANVMQGVFKGANIIPPNFGYKSKVMMRDLATATGATYFSEETGDDVTRITMDDLGYAGKVVITKERTILYETKEEAQEAMTEMIEQIKEAEEDEVFKRERISKLSGGVAVVYAGGHSKSEQSELYDRIEDGVLAVESALESGIVAGGGVALRDMTAISKSPILGTALAAPYFQIFENAHQEAYGYKKSIWERIRGAKNYEMKSGVGKDLKTGKVGSMFDLNIIDPAKVTVNTLRNAFSVAKTILSTNTVVTIIRNEGSK